MNSVLPALWGRDEMTAWGREKIDMVPLRCLHAMTLLVAIAATACGQVPASGENAATSVATNTANQANGDYGALTDINALNPDDFDLKAFDGFINAMRSGVYGAQRSLYVRHRGSLVWAERFSNYDEPVVDKRTFNWRRTIDGAGKLHDIQSATKSIGSLLVGIAVDQGHIESIDDPISDYLPAYAALFGESERKRRITVRHLLEMKGGFSWLESLPEGSAQEVSDAVAVLRHSEYADYVLRRKMIEEPGEVFRYNSGASILLGKVLQNAVGGNLRQFATDNLFAPLGISNWYWIGEDDNQGLPHFGGGLQMFPGDMAKIGQLVLNAGRWGGQQIVSELWIDESTSSKIGSDAEFGYGYQWWLLKSDDRKSDYDVVFAWGWGHQHIFIFPEREVVMSTNAGNYATNEPRGVAAFRRGLVPTLNTKSAQGFPSAP